MTFSRGPAKRTKDTRARIRKTKTLSSASSPSDVRQSRVCKGRRTFEKSSKCADYEGTCASARNFDNGWRTRARYGSELLTVEHLHQLSTAGFGCADSCYPDRRCR